MAFYECRRLGSQDGAAKPRSQDLGKARSNQPRRSKESLQALRQQLTFPRSRLALPHCTDIPPFAPKGTSNRHVALTVPGNFIPPIRHIALRFAGAAPAVMAMPKTTVHENDLPARAPDEIRAPRQVLAVELEPIPKGVE